jgi:RNA polymerase sigma-70 factor (ECF subfamily)
MVASRRSLASPARPAAARIAAVANRGSAGSAAGPYPAHGFVRHAGMHDPDTVADDLDIVSRRAFAATPARVFAAFADPAQLAEWWGPDGFSNRIDHFDLRDGGEWRFTMRGPDGTDYPNHVRFVAIAPERRIVFDHLEPLHCFRMTMELAARGEQTELTWRMRFADAAESARVRPMVVVANEQNFDRLAAHLARDTAVSALLRDEVRATWLRCRDSFEPLRAELYRYCRHLTRSPWDAEDLVQDTLARAFATLARTYQEVGKPRAFLFRIASNLWIDRTRRQQPEALAGEVVSPPAVQPVDRAAATTLLGALSPQERAAVVLKDVFDLTLEEVAATLQTTVGAIKAALHRGRGRLQAPVPAERAAVRPAVVDAFCAAFAARDLDRLAALLLDDATVEVVGAALLQGRDAGKNALQGMLFGARRMSGEDPRGGMDARWRRGVRSDAPRLEVREHRGEFLLLSWYRHDDGEHVRAITRIAAEPDGLARVRNYFYTPECLAEVCAELGVSCRTNGYRHC